MYLTSCCSWLFNTFLFETFINKINKCFMYICQCLLYSGSKQRYPNSFVGWAELLHEEG